MMAERSLIQKLTQEIEELKTILKMKEDKLHELLIKPSSCELTQNLSTSEISRYSRQMIIPSFGVDGQMALKKSSVLVVGAGGLGCPASLYLVAAGVGQLTIVDYDEVDLTNLHRQILHTEYNVNQPKVYSAAAKLRRLNSCIKLIPLKTHISSETVQHIVSTNKFDVVIDGTDNVASRYLLNDVCVFNKIPLVSGSALQMEGQLTVYNYKGGICYRCLFPVPPPPSAVTNCGDGGVLGPVPGVIGVLQALEAIKIITGMHGVLSGRLLLFDGAETTFRTVKLRNKNHNCEVCGDKPSITSLIDYELFCGSRAHDKVEDIEILKSSDMVTAKDFSRSLSTDTLTIDVRPVVEYAMCKLPNTVNIPYTSLHHPSTLDTLKELVTKYSNKNVYVLCRRGNDSQRAITQLMEKLSLPGVRLINVNGGLHSYSKHVDSSFPIY